MDTPSPSPAPPKASLWPDTTTLVGDDVLEVVQRYAAASDAAARLAPEALEALRASGYFGLPVPKPLMGGGAGMLECAAIQERLASVDAGVAVGLNMHLFSIGIMVDLWRRKRDLSWTLLEAVATQNRLVASAFAEPGLAGSVLRSNCRARAVDKGYVVTGVKTPCSIAARCDLVCFQFEVVGPGERELLIGMVPRQAPGLRVERSWDALGMRSSESDTIRLEECFVPKDLIFYRSPPGASADPLFSTAILWFCTTTAATYAGVARRALAESERLLKRSKVAPHNHSRADLPAYQGELGDAYTRLLALEAACVSVCRSFDEGRTSPDALLPVGLAVKQTAIDICPDLVRHAIELVGGAAYAREGVLARALRDVQGVHFHPPTRLAARQILGRTMLGLPVRFELDEVPTGNTEAR